MSGLPSPSLLLRLKRLNLLPLKLYIRTLNSSSLHNTSSTLIPQASENTYTNRLNVEFIYETSETETFAGDLVFQLCWIERLAWLLL